MRMILGMRLGKKRLQKRKKNSIKSQERLEKQ
jgi:hypothetical protein